MVVKRKQVTWKTDKIIVLSMRPYIPDVNLDSAEKIELFKKSLYLGGLFVVNEPLTIHEMFQYKPPAYPYLIETQYAIEARVRVGACAIYAGPIRVEEYTRKCIVRIVRHSFIINSCRYLLTNLNLLDPVAQIPSK